MKARAAVSIAALSLASATACGGSTPAHHTAAVPMAPAGASAGPTSDASAGPADPARSSPGSAAASSDSSARSPSAAAGHGGASVAPGQPSPAPDGHYKYEVTTGGDTKDATATVQTLNRNGDDVTQRVTISSGDGSVAAEGVWSPQGATVTESTLSGKGMSFSCTWKPPVQQYTFRLTKNLHWTSSSTCDTSVFGQPTHVTQDVTVTVAGTTTATVADQEVGVWTLDRRVTMKAVSASFSFTSETMSTEWYDPPLDQAVRTVARSHSSATYAGKTRSGDSSTTTVLLSLRPS